MSLNLSDQLVNCVSECFLGPSLYFMTKKGKLLCYFFHIIFLEFIK